MGLNKTLYISSLYNIYGELLTTKQKNIIEDYFFNDLTLAEISQIYNITRQAVLDSVNKSCKILENYEDVLKIFKNHVSIKNLLSKVKTKINNKEILAEIDEYLKVNKE